MRKCFILNNEKDILGKFDAKGDEGIFLGYFLQSKAYRVFNKRTIVVEESIHAMLDDLNIYLRKPYEECNDELNQNLEFRIRT